MSFSEQRAALLRILEIDEKIKDIEHGKEYLLLKRNLKTLEHSTRGYITVNSLDDFSLLVKLRKNSADVHFFKVLYGEKIRRDVDKLGELKKEKLLLRAKLEKMRANFLAPLGA